MKKNVPLFVALKILVALSAAFALAMLILFLLSGRILPSGEDMEASEQLGMALGYVLTSVLFTVVPSVLVFVALAVTDICLVAVKRRGTLIACMVVLPLFAPLFIVSTVPYYVVVKYVPWLYAILITGYIVYAAAIVICAVTLAMDNRERAALAAQKAAEQPSVAPTKSAQPTKQSNSDDDYFV